MSHGVELGQDAIPGDLAGGCRSQCNIVRIRRPEKTEQARLIHRTRCGRVGDGSGRMSAPGATFTNTLTDGRFDGVISTDMLEHCPSEDLPWVIDEIFSFADEFLYLNVAWYPAHKVLPDGKNAHVTIEPPDWWKNRFDAAVTAHPGLRYFTCFDVLEKGPDGKDNLTRLMGKGKSKPKHPGGKALTIDPI